MLKNVNIITKTSIIKHNLHRITFTSKSLKSLKIKCITLEVHKIMTYVIFKITYVDYDGIHFS